MNALKNVTNYLKGDQSLLGELMFGWFKFWNRASWYIRVYLLWLPQNAGGGDRENIGGHLT